MALVRQVLSFSVVGVAATLAHVLSAWALMTQARLDPYVANMIGTCAAFLVSFLGNASFTFRTDRSLWDCSKRYVFVSLVSFVLTSAILAIVQHNRLPTYVYVVIVLFTVPPATFLLAKLWAFKPLPSNA